MNLIAIDTETEAKAPWSVQWCMEPGKARMCYAMNDNELGQVKLLLESPDTLTIVHNALFDVPILSLLDIHPHRVADTMVMAYILGMDSIGLKNLVYRHCNMEMLSYTEVVQSAGDRKALDYLNTIMEMEWSDPDPVADVNVDGSIHLRFPRNIKAKVKRLLKDYEKDPSVNLRERWKGMEYKEDVLAALGNVQPAFLSDVDPEFAIQYACRDADATFRLYPILWKLIQDAGLEKVFWIDMGIITMVSHMVHRGAKVNRVYLESLEDIFDKEMTRVQIAINRIAHKHVNPGSYSQVGRCLYELGIFSNPNMSTAAEVLDHFHQHEIVRLIQEYREYGKLKSTYVPLSKKADRNDRIHTTYSQTRTETSRGASDKPNLQNIPSRTEVGRAIRRGFIAPDGCHLVSLDYSQIEMRMAAHESQDPIMLEVYLNNGDIHEVTRKAMYRDIPKTESQRICAKTVNFATIFDVTPKGLLNQMRHSGVYDVTENDCGEFIHAFLTKYSRYNDYMAELRAMARRNSCVKNMFGRIKWVPEIYSTDRCIREAGFRQAINYVMQAGASDILKIAIKDLTPVWKSYMDAGCEVYPILQVHDELVWEIEDDMVDTVIPVFIDIMENVVELSIPLKVEAKIGLNWADMEEWVGWE